MRVCADGGGRAIIDEPGADARASPRARRPVSFTARITEPGTTTLQCARRATPGDRHPGNDEGVLAIATEREPRVLCLEGTPAASPRSRARWRASRSPPTCVLRARCRATSTSGATTWSCWPTSRGPRSPTRRWLALDNFVRAGGGLLVAGGTQSFGPGGYTARRLESMLPVRLDIPDKREEATLALALVIDGRGRWRAPRWS